MQLFKPKYNSLTDEELMKALSKGDQRAFDELYKRFYAQLLGYFKNMLWGDREKAEDMVHDIFAKIIKNPDYFDTNRSFRTWLFSVASNMCKNEYKKQAVRKNTSTGVEDYRSISSSTNVLAKVQDIQFQQAFEENLSKMDEKHREVFALRHLEGLSMKEIAEIMEINEGTVKSRLFYATKFLAEKLKVYNPVLNY
ncbi:MAG: RNA polymerase sigma factor [Flavobacteriales bacterium]|nr:RNA polymerase sigma factor [Flavobacteriales bacterium]